MSEVSFQLARWSHTQVTSSWWNSGDCWVWRDHGRREIDTGRIMVGRTSLVGLWTTKIDWFRCFVPPENISPEMPHSLENSPYFTPPQLPGE
uniref:Uncharacterized protein n=1 Tax=Cannabis sativa TaxID=3483 RepID=A0A803QDF5_CANSA